MPPAPDLPGKKFKGIQGPVERPALSFGGEESKHADIGVAGARNIVNVLAPVQLRYVGLAVPGL